MTDDIMTDVQETAAQAEPPLNLGSCILRRPEIANVVQSTMRHFDADRYYLLAWCVMPNHVHVVFSPLGTWDLSRILHSWKSFSSNQINKILARRGTLWERESFDHLIRSIEHCERFVEYIEGNPVAAGLCQEPAQWPFGSAAARIAGWKHAPQWEFTNPRTTPIAPLRSRGELPHLEKELATYFVTWRLLDAVVLNKDARGQV